MRTILFTAPIATGLLLFAGAGIAQAAEVTTSNDAHGDSISYEGTSNAAADHMDNDGPGIVQGTTPGHRLIAKLIPVLDEDGNPVLNANGNQVYEIKNTWVPVSNGVDPFTIDHP